MNKIKIHKLILLVLMVFSYSQTILCSSASGTGAPASFNEIAITFAAECGITFIKALFHPTTLIALFVTGYQVQISKDMIKQQKEYQCERLKLLKSQSLAQDASTRQILDAHGALTTEQNEKIKEGLAARLLSHNRASLKEEQLTSLKDSLKPDSKNAPLKAAVQ